MVKHALLGTTPHTCMQPWGYGDVQVITAALIRARDSREPPKPSGQCEWWFMIRHTLSIIISHIRRLWRFWRDYSCPHLRRRLGRASGTQPDGQDDYTRGRDTRLWLGIRAASAMPHRIENLSSIQALFQLPPVDMETHRPWLWLILQLR